MPLAIEPGTIHRVTLRSDAGKAEPATFLFKILTGREQLRLLTIYDGIEDKPIPDALSITKFYDALRDSITGWENIGRRFDPEDLEDVLTIAEAMELVNQLLLQRPTGEEKKLRLAIGMMYGAICKTCRGPDHCTRPPTETEPIEMECPECSGTGCEICSGGLCRIARCPIEIVDAATWRCIEYADLYKKAFRRSPAELLDQAGSFTAAARWIFNEQNYWKQKLRIANGE